eukprot:tig00021623_g23013.t1
MTLEEVDELEDDEQRMQTDPPEPAPTKAAAAAVVPDDAEAQSDHDEACYLCELEGELLCCDACTNAYHLECLGLDVIPEGDYLCPVCVAEKEGTAPPKKGSLKPKASAKGVHVKKKRGRPPKARDGSEPEPKKRKAVFASRPRARSSGESDGGASDGDSGAKKGKGGKKRRGTTDSDDEFDKSLMMDEDEAERYEAARRAKARASGGEEDGEASDHEANCCVCGEGGELLCCDKCPKVYHIACLQIESVPEGDWLCPVCVRHPGPRPRPARPPRGGRRARAAGEPEGGRVDRILARRLRREARSSPAPTAEAAAGGAGERKEGGAGGGEGREVEEFLVKWQGRSYRQCAWVRRFVLEQLARAKLRNFLEELEEEEEEEAGAASAEAAELALGEDEGAVNGIRPEWLEVERVLARRGGEGAHEFLCKWRALPYSESTWEAAADILPAFQAQVESFLVREGLQAPPPPPPTGPGSRLAPPRPRDDFREFPAQPHFIAGGALHGYQLEGLNWLRYKWCEGTNVILADEMGLGKTVQCVSFVSALQYEFGAGPFLVLGPLATLPNWQREFEKWAPHLHVVFYYGDQESRGLIRRYEFGRGAGGAGGEAGRRKLDVLLTSYELAFRDAKELRRFQWASLVVDEGHRLKNSEGKLFQALVDFRTDHRVLLTGTPLQNEQRELFNLLQFLDPEKFRTFGDFQMNLEGEDRAGQIARLHEVLRPRMLRRIKKDVLGSLPPKEEFIVRVELTRRQRDMYKNIFTRNYEALSKGVKRAGTVAFGNLVMELRKCCNHPFLFEAPLNEAAAAAASNPAELDRLRIEWCGKLELLDRMLAKLKAQGHRVIIFSQMTRVLDILADYCRARGHEFERLDGGIASAERQAAIDRFNAPNSPDFIFLLSTRAGGVGINLATADTVIIYDSDWNPHNDIQALSRAHRIGQERKVMIYRMVTRRTVEERMVQRAKSKLTLELLLVKKLDGAGRSMKEKELEDILRFGAEAIFAEEAEAAAAGGGGGPGGEGAAGGAGGAGPSSGDPDKGDRIYYDDAAIDKFPRSPDPSPPAPPFPSPLPSSSRAGAQVRGRPRRLLDRSQEALEEKAEQENEYLGSFKVARLWQSRAEGEEGEAEGDEEDLGALDEEAAPGAGGKRRGRRPAGRPASSSEPEKRYWEFLKEGYEELQARRHASMGKGQRRRNAVAKYAEGGSGSDSEVGGSESGESFKPAAEEEEPEEVEEAATVREAGRGKKAAPAPPPPTAESLDWESGPEHPLLEGAGKDARVLGLDTKERGAFWALFVRFGADLRSICATAAGVGVKGGAKRRGRGGPLSKRTPYEIRRYGMAFLSWISQPSRAGVPVAQDTFPDGVPKEIIFGGNHLWRVREALARLAVLSLIAAKVRDIDKKGGDALTVSTPHPTDWHRSLQNLPPPPKPKDPSSEEAAKEEEAPARLRWTPKHDLALLRGILRHGHGEWRAIARDSNRALHDVAVGEARLPGAGARERRRGGRGVCTRVELGGGGAGGGGEGGPGGAAAAEAEKAARERAAKEAAEARERREEAVQSFVAKRARLVEAALAEEYRATLPPPPPAPAPRPRPSSSHHHHHHHHQHQQQRAPLPTAPPLPPNVPPPSGGVPTVERLAAYAAALRAQAHAQGLSGGPFSLIGQLPPSPFPPLGPPFPWAGALPPGFQLPVVPPRAAQPQPTANRPVLAGPAAAAGHASGSNGPRAGKKGQARRRRPLLPEAGPHDAQLRASILLHFLTAECTAQRAMLAPESDYTRLANDMRQVVDWVKATKHAIAGLVGKAAGAGAAS